jgi:acyl-CoA synthetase (AMP-forming)/AMP-acid ligase II
MNLVEALETQLIKDPSRIAIRYLLGDDDREETLTCAQLRNKIIARAKDLKSKAGGKGATAVLIYTPSIDFVISFFACLYAGIIAVPSYPPIQRRLTNDLLRIELICRDSEAKMIIADSNSSKLIKTSIITENLKSFLSKFVPFSLGTNEEYILKNLPIIVTNEIEIEEKMDSKISTTDEPIAFIQYSSGSTGNPKGVVVTHENLMANILEISKKIRFTDKSVALSWLPHYHDMGLIGYTLAPLIHGNTIVLLSPFDYIEKPIRWLKAITKYRATITGAPNFGFELCLKALADSKNMDDLHLDLSSLDAVLCGAEPINADIPARVYEAWKKFGFKLDTFMPVYGLAEHTLLVTSSIKRRNPVIRVFNNAKLQNNILEESNEFYGDKVKKLISCGTAIDDHEVKIVDPETHEVLGERIVGEIWLRGKSVAKGYWNREEETEECFNAFTADGKGPYLRTGDLGFLIDSELFVYGRIKDLIIIHGKKFAPQDIEFSAQNAHPGVRRGNLAAFYVERNNEEKLILIAEVATHKYNLNFEEVSMAILKQVATDHEIALSEIVLVPPRTIFKTTSGKIKRGECKRAYLSGELKSVYAWKSISYEREKNYV